VTQANANKKTGFDDLFSVPCESMGGCSGDSGVPCVPEVSGSFGMTATHTASHAAVPPAVDLPAAPQALYKDNLVKSLVSKDLEVSPGTAQQHWQHVCSTGTLPAVHACRCAQCASQQLPSPLLCTPAEVSLPPFLPPSTLGPLPPGL
jgi:hypothetical protein